MRNFLAFIGLVVVLFAGLGYHYNWYRFAWSPGKDGKQHINVELDTKKMGDDVQSGLQTGADRGGQFVKDNLKKEIDPASPEFVGPPESKLVGPPEPPKSRSFFSVPSSR